MSCASPTSLYKTKSMSLLVRAIFQRDWPRVQALVKPRTARTLSWQYGLWDGTLPSHVLPLHLLLIVAESEDFVNDAFPSALETLMAAYPAALTLPESAYERLPLHCAARSRATRRVWQCLVEAYPSACTVPDALKRWPLHYALLSSCELPVLRYVLNVTCPKTTAASDVKGLQPLHMACATGNLAVVQAVGNWSPPSAASVSGFWPRHCVPLYARERRDILEWLSDHERLEQRNELNDTLDLSSSSSEREYVPHQTKDPQSCGDIALPSSCLCDNRPRLQEKLGTLPADIGPSLSAGLIGLSHSD